MPASWITEQETWAPPKEQQALPFPSSCCGAPQQMHWPCDKSAQCSACGECAICGGPSFEAEVMREIEQQRRYRR